MGSKFKYHRARIAMEVVDFQANTFGNDIEGIMSSIKNKLDRDPNSLSVASQAKNFEEIKQLKDVIFKRLGLRVNFTVHTVTAAAMPFYSNKHHIFINNFFHGRFTIDDQETILKKANNKTGTVDTVKAKLGGLFSEYVNQVYMNFAILFVVMKMSPAEVTAVLLHELGHLFYVCEYTDRMETNNQILANVAKSLKNDRNKADVNYVFKELKAGNDKITKEDADAIVNGTKIVAGVALFKAAAGMVKNQMTNTKYDETAFEALSDNFASRFGYGRALVSGLDKLYTFHGSYEKDQSMVIIANTIEMTFFVLTLVAALYTISVGWLGWAVVSSFLFLIKLRYSGENSKDYTYDELQVRYKRVRNDAVEFIKLSGASKDELSNCLDGIYLIDDYIKTTHKPNSLVSKLSSLLFTDHRDAKASIVEQQLLEELAANDLFVKSAELQTLS